MANNLIQIKRSLNTATPASLANGELAYTANGDVLYIGSNGTIKAIGGDRSPGTLTANQALVVNSSSWMNSVKAANLVIEELYANGSHGTPGHVLVTAGAGSNAYWASAGTLAVSPGGSNTQIQFNDSGSLAASAGFIFNKDSNTVTISNNVFVGANVELNTTSLLIGNSTVNTAINSSSVTTGSISVTSASITNASITKIYANTAFGSGGQVLHANSTGGIYWAAPASTVNNLDDLSDVATSSVSAGQILIANSSGVFRNVSLSGDITITDAGVVTVGFDSIALGTDTTGDFVSTITAGNGLSGNGTGEGSSPTIAVVAGDGVASNATGVHVIAGSGIASNSTGVHVVAGTGVVSNATGVHIGQAVGTSDNVVFNDLQVNGNTVLGSNSSDLVSVSGRFNSSLVPSANVTYDLGTSNLRWKDLYLSGTSIILGDSTITSTAGTLSLGNTQSSDFSATGNVTIGSNTSDVVAINALLGSNILLSTNATFSIGNNTIRLNEIHSANVHSEFGYFDQDVSISGNLTVSGTLTTVSANNISVTDSFIELASNNTVSDVLDIGLYGNYQVSGGLPEITGFFRDATDDKWKLFKGLQVAPTTTIDVANATYQTATMQAFLDSGALQTNSTSVSLSANSTVSVSITANSVTLATALAGTSGGTGLSSYTAEDILVANSSNGFRKLVLGSVGYVLQSNGTSLVYDTLDGGTF